MSRGSAGFLLAAMAAALGGCAVGPDYEPAAPPTDAEWLAPRTAPAAAAVPDAWWSLLDDQELDTLLGLAARDNLDIRVATARVDEARALRGIARSAFWPQAVLYASRTSFEQSLESPGAAGSLIEAGLIDRDQDFYTAALDASWEIDLFGGNRRRAEAAGARLEAAVAVRDAARLSALAETASAYFELRGAQQRLAIARDNIESQQRTLDLTRRKVDAGLARRIDALRAEAQLDALRAGVPALVAAIRASAWRLAVLTGRAPGDVTKEVAREAGLPAAPRALPVGLRAEVLRRRPDVVAAERALAAATAEIGVATADFFPRFVLSGSLGFEAGNAASLGDARARTSALVPFVSWPLFQGGRLRAGLEAADARATAAAADYERSVLAALADAESAISDYAEELASFERLHAAAAASREAAHISQRLYDQGLADFLTVLDAERRRNQAEDAEALSHTRLLLKLTRVYKALGGGWEVEARI